MFLQTIYVSDICNGIGTSIKQQYWDGPQVNQQTAYDCLSAAKPTSSEWQLWHKGLTKALGIGHNKNLAAPLGKWIHHTRAKGGYFLDRSGDQTKTSGIHIYIYHKDADATHTTRSKDSYKKKIFQRHSKSNNVFDMRYYHNNQSSKHQRKLRPEQQWWCCWRTVANCMGDQEQLWWAIVQG